MPRKSAHDRKAEIVTTTLRLADELGPDRLTTQAVADEVGLTQPAIFRHFPSKQALWLAVAEQIATGMAAEWERELGNKTDPLQRLAALVLVQFRQIEANPAIPAILHSRELQAENADLRQRFGALMISFQGLLRSELKHAQEAGMIRMELAPEDGAVLIISLIQGMAIRWSLGNRKFALAEEGARVLGAQIALFRREPGEGRGS